MVKKSLRIESGSSKLVSPIPLVIPGDGWIRAQSLTKINLK